MSNPDVLLGALAADSLGMPCHWVYQPENLEQSFGTVDRLLQPPPGSYHADQPRGGQTHLGHQCLVLFESLQEAGGWDEADFRDRLRRFWETSNSYRDKATLAFLEGRTPESDELAGAVRAVSIISVVEDDRQWAELAGEQAGVTHSARVSEVAAMFGDLALHLNRGNNLEVALRSVFGEHPAYSAASELRRCEPTEAIGKLGRDCSLESALPSVLCLLLRGPGYRTRMIENVMAGGDSAARGLLVGGLLALVESRGAVPEEWFPQATDRLYLG